MRNALAVLLFTAAGLAAQASASTGATAPKAAKKAAVSKKATSAPQPLIIPKDAVANPDGTYSWKDKQGKTWLLVKTPFGVMKSEAPVTSTVAGNAAAAGSMAGVKAFDEGDKVRFERPSPFGAIKWEKNKTELTDDERGLVNSQINGQNAKQE